MRVTIIPLDGYVSVDGEGFSKLDLSFIDPTINAVQWYGQSGEIERKDQNGSIIANEKITSIASFQAALDVWQIAKDQSPSTEETEYVPQSITRRQCAVELRERQLITPQEALDMTRIDTPPALVAQIFSAMSTNDRIVAETDFAADTYLRTNPLLIQIMSETGATEDDIDQFFRDASAR